MVRALFLLICSKRSSLIWMVAVSAPWSAFSFLLCLLCCVLSLFPYCISLCSFGQMNTCVPPSPAVLQPRPAARSCERNAAERSRRLRAWPMAPWWWWTASRASKRKPGPCSARLREWSSQLLGGVRQAELVGGLLTCNLYTVG